MYKNTHRVTITNEYPTNILKDFATFLDYFQNKDAKLTKANGYLTRTDLLALYELMSEPKLAMPEKSNQPDYPLLHLFYILGLELKLLQKVSAGSGLKATINRERLDIYQSLTPSEQYVTLLDCFWLKADWDELQGGFYGKGPDNIDFLFEYLVNCPVNTELKIKQEDELRVMLYRYEHFLFYLEYFGLWKVELDEEKAKHRSAKYHGAETLILTPLFKSFQKILSETFENRVDERMSHMEALFGLFGMKQEVQPRGKKGFNSELFPLLQPLFAAGELKKKLDDETQQMIVGKYVFKVSLNQSCWRTIQLSESHTLLDFHLLIQRAFEFDDDHLYAFYMDGKKFGKRAYHSPMDVHDPFVNEIEIGELQLFVGQKFLYLFDFGVEWEFSIEVIRITEGKPGTRAEILNIKGESPNQYGF